MREEGNDPTLSLHNVFELDSEIFMNVMKSFSTDFQHPHTLNLLHADLSE